MQKYVRRSTGTTQVLTCEAKVPEIKRCELREALDDEVDVRRWELVIADIERRESLELGHGPRQGCRHELGYCWYYTRTRVLTCERIALQTESLQRLEIADRGEQL